MHACNISLPCHAMPILILILTLMLALRYCTSTVYAEKRDGYAIYARKNGNEETDLERKKIQNKNST